MPKRNQQHILDVLEAARRLMALADEGESDAEEDSCRILFATVRDCAYRLQNEADRERRYHVEMGTWESGGKIAQHESDHESTLSG